MSGVFDIAIVGGGASGIITCHQLAKKMGKSGKFAIIDPNPTNRLGEGLAYKDRLPALLLNVPADRMGVDPEKPGDFASWLKTHRPAELSELQRSHLFPFVSRHYFAEYLQSKYDYCVSNSNLTHLQAFVQDCSFSRGTWKLVTREKNVIESRAIVLATGYGPIRGFEAFEHLGRHQLITSAELERLSEIRSDEDLLILGTGLSAVDAWRQLKSAGHRGKIQFLSRHGFFPEAFSPEAKKRSVGVLSGLSPRQLFSHLKVLYRALPDPAAQAGLFLSVREQAQAIWSTWSRRERSRFREHLEPIWKTVRHRLPPEVAKELHSDLKQGRVSVHKGRLLEVKGQVKKVDVAYGPRGQSSVVRLPVERIISALGPLISVLPNVENDEGGSENQLLWRVGPLNSDVLGESTAIHEIREQAQSTAKEISELFAGGKIEPALMLHPKRQGETYREHFTIAVRIAIRLTRNALKLVTHAVLPFIYSEDTSNDIRDLARSLSVRRKKSSKKNEIIDEYPKTETEKKWAA